MSPPEAPNSSSLLRWAGLFAVLAALAFFIDIPVAALCRDRCLGGEVGNLIRLSEVFAHGMGVGAIILTVAVLDPANRRRLHRLAGLSLGAGLVCDVFKLLIPRARPGHGELPETALATFLGWEPFAEAQGLGDMLDHGIQSFPSGHTTVAVGLAIGLMWLYPRGRGLFAFFALLAGSQRVVFGAHFPSDVLAAGALACIVAAACFTSRGLGGWFDRFEANAPVA
jgi:membrane-associated phospholipid phosphatase